MPHCVPPGMLPAPPRRRRFDPDRVRRIWGGPPMPDMGGAREPPAFDRGAWMEVTHIGPADPADGWHGTWFYAARGSGLWYFTGDRMIVDDIVDLARYFNVSHTLDKAELLTRFVFPRLSAMGIHTVRLVRGRKSNEY